MATPLNQVTLIGRVGHAPDISRLTDGASLARLKLYQTEREAGGARRGRGFHLSIWNDLAQKMYSEVRRGDKIMVQGKLVPRSRELNGQQVTTMEVQVHFYMLVERRPVTPPIWLNEPAVPYETADRTPVGTSEKTRP